MERIKKMSGKQKVRVLSLLVIVIILMLSILGYASEIRSSMVKIDYAENVNIDGSDFTAITNLFVAGTNGLLQLMVILATGVAMLIISLIFLVPWRLIAIRKNSQIEEIEVQMAKGMFAGFIIISLLAGLVITRFTNILFIAVLVLITAVLLWLLCVIPLKGAYKRTADTNTN